MGVPNSLLNSIMRIANENQKVDMQIVNQHMIMREASEQIESHRSRQNGRLKSRSGGESL
jgi:hypothetical protein